MKFYNITSETYSRRSETRKILNFNTF